MFSLHQNTILFLLLLLFSFLSSALVLTEGVRASLSVRRQFRNPPTGGSRMDSLPCLPVCSGAGSVAPDSTAQPKQGKKELACLHLAYSKLDTKFSLQEKPARPQRRRRRRRRRPSVRGSCFTHLIYKQLLGGKNIYK